MTLRQALTEHRAQCASCTDGRGCAAYLDVVRQYTAARQIPALPVARSVILSVREAT